LLCHVTKTTCTGWPVSSVLMCSPRYIIRIQVVISIFYICLKLPSSCIVTYLIQNSISPTYLIQNSISATFSV